MDYKKECYNCGRPLETDQNYCPTCGQKNKTKVPSILDLINDVIGDIFNIDSRFFKTLGKLFIPGELTIAFFSGQHKKYFSPFRVLLVTLLIALAITSIKNKDSLEVENSGIRQLHHAIAIDSLKNRYKVEKYHLFNSFQEVDTNVINSIKDSILVNEVSKFEGINGSVIDTSAIVDTTSTSSNLLDIISSMLTASEENRTKLDLEEIAYTPINNIAQGDEYSWIEKLILRQSIKGYRSPGAIISLLFSNFTWMIILTIPFLAIMLKLLYWRKGIYYIQHLVFLYHTTAFLFVLFILGALFYTDSIALTLIPVLFIIGLVYQLIAFYRVYNDSWIKGILKFTIYSLWSSLVFSVSVFLYFAINFAIL